MLTFFNSSTPDQAILSGLQEGGSQRRIQEKKLYEQYFYFIRQGVQQYRVPEEDAASAYSDTIITVINNIVSGRFEGRSSLKSYAYQIFMNKCVDLVRKDTTNKSKVHHTGAIDSLVNELPDKARSVIQQLIAKNERSELLQRLKALGDKCRQILLLFEDGYSDKEIASAMQYSSPEVVKTSRLRCLEKLKKNYHRQES